MSEIEDITSHLQDTCRSLVDVQGKLLGAVAKRRKALIANIDRHSAKIKHDADMRFKTAVIRV